MVRYSVTVCNYEMVETLEPSLRSVCDQLTDEYEVVVVDGGSRDGSLAVLDRLADEYDVLRYVALDPDPDRRLGADRQRAVEEADGEYVLTQMDVDDRYREVIRDFVDLYHQFEAGVDSRFYLSGTGINVAPRDLLLDVPYRNLASAEDRDLWRRLLAEDAVVWLEHGPVRTEIGYEKSLRDRLERDFSDKVADAQVGISLASCLAWSVSHPRYHILEERRGPLGRAAKSAYDLLTYPLAFRAARNLPRFETPPRYRVRGALEAAIANRRMTAGEVADAYGVAVDCSRLSETGRETLCHGLSGDD